MIERAHLIRNQRFKRSFQRIRDCGDSHLIVLFSPESSNKNFEIAILFSIVERSNNHTFRDNMNLTAPGEKTASYKTCPQFTYSICYWKVYTLFFRGRGGGGGLCSEKFSRVRIFSGEGRFQEWTFQGKFHTGRICQNSRRKFFCFVLLCLIRLNFTCVDFVGIFFLPELELSGEIFHGSYVQPESGEFAEKIPSKGKLSARFEKRSEIKIIFK